MLRVWRCRFTDLQSRRADKEFDERNHRMWAFCLASCAVGFAEDITEFPHLAHRDPY